MSRVVLPERRRLRRALTLLAALALAAGSLAQPAAAQAAPACSETRTHDCRLPDWSVSEQRDIASPFGSVEGIAWLEDDLADTPVGGLDIVAAGIGRVTIDDPQAVRQTVGLSKLGKLKKAVPGGASLLVRIVLDRDLDEVPAEHTSVHVATDIDGSRTDNVPSGVGSPDFPFAGSQDVYSLTWASTTGKTRLLDSDLAKGWYKDKDPFAAAWAAPGVLDMLIRPAGLGEGIRVITHTAGETGGYDTLSLGTVGIPVNGRLGLVPSCIEGSISALPYTVSRLVENGQVVQDVEARASWRGGAAVPIDGAARQALAKLIDEADPGEGRVTIPAWVNLFEDGIVIRQRTDLELALGNGDEALLATELGLTRRGYDVLRAFEPDETGDRALDAWLAEATDALKETMPPWRLNKRSGVLIGETVGACIPWIETPPEPEPEVSQAPATDAPAASA